MGTSQIRNPSDASNTGPYEATRTRTEDSVTKHWPRVIVEDNRVRSGVYHLHSGALVVQAAAHAAGAGWLWLVNHVGSSNLLALRRIRFATQHGSALATPTAPRILIERFAFTGTPSGGQITAAKRRTSDQTPSTWSLRTANTGLTQTAGAPVTSFFPVSAVTAVGACPPGVDEWFPPGPEDHVILGAGEGLRVYQPDAGTASDTRRFVLDLTVEEAVEF